MALVGRVAVLAPFAVLLALACAACGGSGGKTTTSTTAATTTAAKADLALGKSIYKASCAGCHALADAGAIGSVGPNVDEAKLSVAELVDITTNGRTGNGTMPAFVGSLTAQQIQDVAAYISSVAGK